jgi:hypothetical protein
VRVSRKQPEIQRDQVINLATTNTAKTLFASLEQLFFSSQTSGDANGHLQEMANLLKVDTLSFA